MSVVIDGTTGVSGVSGSASTPALQGEDTNTGVFFPAADTVAVATAGAEAMRIASSGYVGIGTTNPNYNLHINSAFGSAQIQFTYRASGSGVSDGFFLGSGTAGGFIREAENLPITFSTNNIERARITAGGDLQFNSGYGSVATAYGCRAWVNFDGFSGAIRGSGNVSSVTYNGTGQSTVNFATAMPDANYSAVCSAHSAGYNRQSNGFPYYLGYSAGSIIIWTGNTINAVADNMSHVNVAVFR
jgi:hypothetical protein